MMSALRRLSAGLLLALVLAPAAQAASPDLEGAMYAFWGQRLTDTCPNGVSVQLGSPASDDFEEAEANTVGWARPGICVVHLNVYRDFGGHWAADCPPALHEAGHIIGKDHDWRGKGGIMTSSNTIVFSIGTNLKTGRTRRYWSGTGVFWCQRYIHALQKVRARQAARIAAAERAGRMVYMAERSLL